MRFAVTGHRGLPRETAQVVDAALREEISGTSGLVGVSCLADGADALFAQAVLDRLTEAGAAVYRTDQAGDITITR